MKIKNKIIILISIFLLLVGGIVVAKYTSSQNGKVSFSVAKPISRVSIKDTKLWLSNYSDKPSSIYFSVYNYDEKNNISEIKMDYSLTMTVTQANAPLNYSLYKINSNGTEEKIGITVNNGIIKTNKIEGFDCTKKEKADYRLDITFDRKSNVDYANNLGISIKVDNIQAKI